MNHIDKRKVGWPLVICCWPCSDNLSSRYSQILLLTSLRYVINIRFFPQEWWGLCTGVERSHHFSRKNCSL